MPANKDTSEDSRPKLIAVLNTEPPAFGTKHRSPVDELIGNISIKASPQHRIINLFLQMLSFAPQTS